ncbi:MAG TPA: SMP-30/gluconolactonase/LRE family protein [Acidimicrobiia bacterium]
MDVDVTEIATGLQFPEGPVWMADGTVLVVEIGRKTVDRVHPDGTVEVIAEPGGGPNGLAIGPDGAVYVANSGGFGMHDMDGLTVTDLMQPDDYSGGRIERVDLGTGACSVLYDECDGHPLIGPNDLVFDETGGFWFTDHGKWRPRERTHGGLYYARADGSSIREVAYPLESPNGVGLSPDGRRVYVAETFTARVYAWDLTGPGEIDTSGPFGAHGVAVCGLPGYQFLDSLGVDSAGNVVVGTLVNGGLTVIAPSGEILEHVALPDPMVTNVCFGGDERRTAFVTCSGTGKLVSFEWPRPGLELAFNA